MRLKKKDFYDSVENNCDSNFCRILFAK